jgi:hypothetical protein
MPNFFPRHTSELKFEEPKAFRRFSFSLVEMALVTGVLLRVYRVLVLTHGSNNWVYIGGSIAVGLLFLLGMVTAHLANFPLHDYAAWRAPLFAFVEVLAEMAVSALLIAVGRGEWDGARALGRLGGAGAECAALSRNRDHLVVRHSGPAIVQIVRRTIVHEDERACHCA